MCVCVCGVCVCVRERERDRDRGRERQRERESMAQKACPCKHARFFPGLAPVIPINDNAGLAHTVFW